jgi:high affinity Mn2+ porin
MKLKFIFSIARASSWLYADRKPGASPAFPAHLRHFCPNLALLLMIASSAMPMLAQNSDAPSTAKSDTAAQRDPARLTDRPPDDSIETMLPHFKNPRFWLSGQANFIFQTHPPFHAPYSGPNSLSPRYEKATSRLMTLYAGVRLNNSTELLFDLEEAGGAALSTGLGLAGNTDLDIVRNPLLSKAP